MRMTISLLAIPLAAALLGVALLGALAVAGR